MKGIIVYGRNYGTTRTYARKAHRLAGGGLAAGEEAGGL